MSGRLIRLRPQVLRGMIGAGVYHRLSRRETSAAQWGSQAGTADNPMAEPPSVSLYYGSLSDRP